jgi:hypothetical protein
VNQSFFVTWRKRDGISITPPKLDGLLQAFSDRWPEGLPWPETAPVTMERRPRKNGGKESTRSLDASAPAERIA